MFDRRIDQIRTGLKININPVTMTGGHGVTTNENCGPNVPRRAMRFTQIPYAPIAHGDWV